MHFCLKLVTILKLTCFHDLLLACGRLFNPMNQEFSTIISLGFEHLLHIFNFLSSFSNLLPWWLDMSLHLIICSSPANNISFACYKTLKLNINSEQKEFSQLVIKLTTIMIRWICYLILLYSLVLQISWYLNTHCREISPRQYRCIQT